MAELRRGELLEGVEGIAGRKSEREEKKRKRSGSPAKRGAQQRNMAATSSINNIAPWPRSFDI